MVRPASGSSYNEVVGRERQTGIEQDSSGTADPRGEQAAGGGQPRCVTSSTLDWTQATFGGAVVGGALWAALLYWTLERSPHRATTAGLFPSVDLVIAGACCAALLVAGALVLWLASSRRTRTLGAAITIAGAIGPLVIVLTRLVIAELLILAVLLVAPKLSSRRYHHRGPRRQPGAGAGVPIPTICGLVIGTQVSCFAALFVLILAPLVPLVLWLPLYIVQRSRAFAVGMLSASAGTATLVVCFYALLTVLGS